MKRLMNIAAVVMMAGASGAWAQATTSSTSPAGATTSSMTNDNKAMTGSSTAGTSSPTATSNPTSSGTSSATTSSTGNTSSTKHSNQTNTNTNNTNTNTPTTTGSSNAKSAGDTDKAGKDETTAASDKWWHDRDLNNDGKVTRKEYMKAEKKDSPSKSNTELRKEFADKDTDKDGVVNASEFKAWFEKMGDKLSNGAHHLKESLTPDNKVDVKADAKVKPAVTESGSANAGK